MKIQVNEEKRCNEPQTPCSAEVRDFYERMPYPAPLASLDEHRELYDHSDRRRALFHRMWPTKQPTVKQQILIAGCGTSQAARYALREPEARITAIDISENSLGHTRKLQRKYELRNLELHQLSILDVHELGQTFDQVVCTGVLHHLADPDAGLRSLRNVLRPDGAMQIMVYARYGRSGIYMMQEYCRLLGVTPSNQELRDLTAALDFLPKDHPLTYLLRKVTDFQHPDAVADAFLHPHDRAFTVPQVYEWLERCGISFGRWVEQAPYLAQCGIVAKSPHAARLASLPPRIQHAAVELFRGTIARHSFIAYRDDRFEKSQPITFSNDRWRNYVAIPLPWTTTVRTNLPPGCEAVLINRAHRFTDLILPVDSFENRLLDAIDGRRTLAEILTHVAKDVASERRALTFFEKLWQYDHVVFDASQAA
jgi:2-polyprenyl-3-methyl-5-hydroxy-6-metoxy-1,4-benzoquinol methylase